MTTQPTTCAATLAAAVTDYYEVAEGFFSNDEEHAAGIELARCAEWLLDTPAVRIADHFARTRLRARGLALRTRAAAAALARLPRRAATITSRSLP
ncbi:hypothetical protein ACWEQA_23990 [Nocardia sp. NPDC004085]